MISIPIPEKNIHPFDHDYAPQKKKIPELEPGIDSKRENE